MGSEKKQYLKHLQTANDDTLLVSAADKLHNARAVLSDYREVGDQLWSRFNAPKEDQLWYYVALVDVLEGTATQKRLVAELRTVVDDLKQLAK